MEAGSRVFLDGALGYNDVRFDDPVRVLSLHRDQRSRRGAGLTFGDNLRGGVYYGYDRIPAARRKDPSCESTAHSIGVAFDGDFGALTRGEVRLDYRDQSSPEAAPGGQSYRGLAGALSLSRQLSPSAQITLTGPPRHRPLGLREQRLLRLYRRPGRVLVRPALVALRQHRPRLPGEPVPDDRHRASASPARTRSSGGPWASRGRWAPSPSCAPTTAATAGAPTSPASTSPPTASSCRWGWDSLALR